MIEITHRINYWIQRSDFNKQKIDKRTFQSSAVRNRFRVKTGKIVQDMTG